MRQYKVFSNDGMGGVDIEIYESEGLILQLEKDCQIYNITEDKEQFLGSLSAEALVYIGLEASKYVLNYFLEIKSYLSGLGKSHLLKEIDGIENSLINNGITLCEKWLEDDNSVSKKDLSKLCIELSAESSKHVDMVALLFRGIMWIIQLCLDSDDDDCFYKSVFALSTSLHRIKQISENISNALNRTQPGTLRTSRVTSSSRNWDICSAELDKIVTDFLKSGKHLFMV